MSQKPLPPSPFPSGTVNSKATATLPLNFSTNPQPHFHRLWHRQCLHLAPTVRVPYGPKRVFEEGSGAGAGGRSGSGREVDVNNHRLCMCDDVGGGYYLETVDDDGGGRFVEREVVEEFWKMVGRLGGGKERKGVVGKVLGVIGVGKRGEGKEKGKERRVKRWVPRWRRVEGCCESCTGGQAGR